MRKQIGLVLIAVGFLISGLSSAASFDCTKASSPYEKAVCANPNLSSLDDQLAGAYKDARTKSSDPDGLKKGQIDWIKSTRQCGADVGCIEKAYKSRIVSLSSTSASTPSTQASKADKYKDLVIRATNRLGPDGYGRCMAATLTLVAKKIRGDNISPFTDTVDPLQKILGEVRSSLLSKGVSDSVLDKFLKNGGQVIMSDPDPNLRAMKEFDRCVGEISGS